MTTIETGAVLVVLNVAPELEGAVVDWLLERVGRTGFTSFPVSGHSTSHEHLTVAEQVSGRQHRLQFQVQIGADVLEKFLNDASDTLGGTGIRYWVLPVTQSGHLGDINVKDK